MRGAECEAGKMRGGKGFEETGNKRKKCFTTHNFKTNHRNTAFLPSTVPQKLCFCEVLLAEQKGKCCSHAWKKMDEGMAKCVFRHFKIGPWVNLSSQQTVLPLFSYTHALLHLFMFKTHQCCRSLSCQIGLRWGSVYRHCRTNTSSRFKTPVSVIGNLPHMIQDTAMEGTKMYQEIEGRSVSVS